MHHYFSCRALAVRLRWFRQQISPWLVLAMSTLNLVLSDGVESRQQVRLMVALSRINFADVYELLNDLIW